MSKERQIEEMAQFMAETSHIECGRKPCEECKWCGCEKSEEADCTDYLIAEHLYNAGYRKQSEGEWISNELGGYEYAFYCSECGWVDGYPFNDRHKFCPNCGAKMKGGEE